EVARLRALGVAEVGKLSKRDLWMLGQGLYVGEGAKTIEAIRLSNSNPAVVSIIIRRLKECCGLSDDNISVRLHLYPDNKADDSVKHWMSVTGLPHSHSLKTFTDARQNKKRSSVGKLPYGTA